MTRRQAIRLIALMCAAQVLVQIGAFFWPALVPEMILRWRLSNSEAGWITAAYWFTASTSFANPAVTIARSLSDTFAGIAPAGVGAFILAQLVGAGAATLLSRWLWPKHNA